MTPTERLLWAYRYGHAFNPKYPNLANLDEVRVRKMDGTEADALSLIASWQETDENVSRLVLAFHGRSLQLDGQVGPATEAVMGFKRCGMPDFIPPPGIAFDTGDPALNAAIASMQNATGSGSWPVAGCDPTRRGVHSIRVRIDPARMPSAVKAYHVQALAEVTKAYAEIGLAVRYIMDAASECEIMKRFESLGGSVIGWNTFPDFGTCNRIEGRLDSSYAPSWLMWANLECHETGHGVGLEHTRGSIMNPSILLVDPLTWVGTPSYPNLKKWFGGEPLVPTVPPPGPAPDDPWRGSSVTVQLPGKPGKRFIPALEV